MRQHRTDSCRVWHGGCPEGRQTDFTVPRLGELVHHTIGNLPEQWGRGRGCLGGGETSILQHEGSF